VTRAGFVAAQAMELLVLPFPLFSDQAHAIRELDWPEHVKWLVLRTH